MRRREFHQWLLGSAGTSVLGACGSSIDGTVTLQNGQARLTFSQFGALRTVGGSAVVNISGYSPIIVVRSSDTEAAALSATCTHAGCILAIRRAGEVHCD